MAYLVDGNNLLGTLFPGFHRDPENKLKLIRRLIAFQRTRRVRVILVFDGAAVPDPSGMALPGERFDIIYPPAGETADAVLHGILEGRRDLRHMVVVSSDREVRAFAGLRGAKVCSSREFAAELRRTLRERRAEQELEKEEERPSRLDVKLWSQVFKERP
jgi:predicted RNA-binding protein with PIN domain